MSLPDDSGCIGRRIPLTNDGNSHLPQAREMLSQQPQNVNIQYHPHHMTHHDQYGGYMASGIQGPVQSDAVQQFETNVQHQWYVQHHPQAMDGSSDGHQQPQQAFGQQLPHQPSSYHHHHHHHHQQAYQHVDMSGNANANNSWATVANAMNDGMSNKLNNLMPKSSGTKNGTSIAIDSDLSPSDEDGDTNVGEKSLKKPSLGRGKRKQKVKPRKRDAQLSKSKVNGSVAAKSKRTTKYQQQKEHSKPIGIATGKDVDDNLREVTVQFNKGCECMEQNCFDGLDPDAVYKHRLNIDELTKLEHDMYLMGITMACLESPDETQRQKERKRLRSKYRFKGKEVCVSAFLFLEHTTLHQLKSIRKHLRDHGVTPRTHGNLRKRPHNVFSLDIYQRATNFLRAYFERNSFKEATAGKKRGLICLPTTITCKKIHSEYTLDCQLQEGSGGKSMGYSTFRHFLKEQFPHLRFHKDEAAKFGE